MVYSHRIIAWPLDTPTTRPTISLASTFAAPLLTVRCVVIVLAAVIVAAVATPVNVGEALGAKIVVMSLLLILSEAAFRATGDERCKR